MTRTQTESSEIQRLFSYDSETGLVRRRCSSGTRGKAGSLVGYRASTGHKIVKVEGQNYGLHRIIWNLFYGLWPSGCVDHINGDGCDNRIINLRDVTKRSNSQNIRYPNKNNTSGYLGVSWNRGWVSRIRVGSETIYLGRFKEPQDAHQKYLEAKRIHHTGCTI